jgi:hypothetical protein
MINMKTRKHNGHRTTKFVRIDNSTWIEADIWIPDEVARIQFLQKIQLTKPAPYSGQLKTDSFATKG